MTDADRALIALVDDDAAVCWAVEQALNEGGYAVRVYADAAAARRGIARQVPDAVLTDVRMPGESGLDLLDGLRHQHPLLPVIVMTAHGTMDMAVDAVQRGAFDYLPKPVDLDELLTVLARAVGDRRLAARAEPAAVTVPPAMIGSTPIMQAVYRRIAAAAASDLGVLIRGPTGSGKELVARALHRYSARAQAPFIAVNCGALPDHLVESELFGHEAGAFTDAKTRSNGRIAAAEGGTLLLDEVGELPPAAQVKLLRFLEDQRYVRVGGTAEEQADVRIITATHRDLDALIERGAFRSDLAFRLRVVTIALPSLEQRLDDLPELARHFLARTASRLGRPLSLTEAALTRLQTYHWPGNVRELKHVIEEAAVLATGGIIDADHLPLEASAAAIGPVRGLRALIDSEVARLAAQAPGTIHETLIREVEAAMIQAALARVQGNQLRAAALLGINRITLKKRMDALLAPPAPEPA